MSKIAFLLTLLATVLVGLLPAVPAQAQAARTFLSAAGSDTNNCTNVATPCRHLAAAYAATAANGEIYVLDPANYGSLTITHAVSIEGHGWASIAPVANNPAITINANSTDKINIIGVVLDGTAVTNTTGISFNSGGSLVVRDSVIRNFLNNGILFQPNSASPSQLFVSNTLVSDNGSDGILISPAGSGATTGALDHVNMENNGAVGLDTGASTQNITVTDSVVSNSGSVGIAANAGLSIMVRNSTIANSRFEALLANGAGAIVRVTRSTITDNGSGWAINGGGVITSYSDNNIDGNGANNSTPASTAVYH
jgi:hypothetical protein